MLSASAMAGIDISIEKDVLEVGVNASVTDNTYLFIGGDTDGWVGIGIGYHQFLDREWKANIYYEYGLEEEWLLNELANIDGAKTHNHLFELSATRYLENYSTKLGITTELVRNGFTWLTVDNANKYSMYMGVSYYLKHVYLSTKYEHYIAVDKSDMQNFNQGHANIWEFSLGTIKSFYNFFPYVKVSVFDPNGTYYGLSNSDVTLSINGTFSFR